MPYKTYLQKTGCFFAYARGQCGATARLVVLTLTLPFIALLLLSGVLSGLLPSVALAQPVGAASCPVSITSIAAAPVSSKASEPPSDGWVEVALPDFWQSRWSDVSTVWYRLRWHHDCPGGQAVALTINSISMAGEIRLNDSLLWRDTSLQEPLSRSWNMPRYWLLPDAAVAAGDNTLWIRVTGMPYDRLWLGRLDLGEPTQVRAIYDSQRWLKRDVFSLNLAISLALGFLFLTLWLVRRQESAFGWFALASLTWALFAGTMLATTPWPFANSSDWNRGVSIVFACYCCAFCLFTWQFGQQDFPRLSRLLPALTAGLSLALWWVPAASLPWALIAFMLLYMGILFANCFQFQFHAWRNRERYNVLLALCLLFFLLVGLHDMLLVLNVLPASVLLAPFTAPVAMLFMFLIIADRFARNFNRIESFNTELQTAIAEARDELTRKLRREHELEVKNIRLSERLQLSHDLHDSLGGTLVRSIASVEQSSDTLGNGRFLSMLKELRDDLRQIIDSTSSGANASDETPQEWIAPLRQRFVRLFEELGLSSQWEIPRCWPRQLTAMQKVELLRFMEEALSNAIKHSQADRIDVSMQTTAEGHLALCVMDNGVGFDVDSAFVAGGVGMRSMSARARKLGGQLDIRSQPGATTLRLQLA